MEWPRPYACPQSPQVAVGAIVLKEGNILLVKRSQAPGQGLWAIPGGSVELGETLQEAAEREVKEETGLTIRARGPIHAFDLIERNETGRIRFHYVIIDLAADYVSGDLAADDDACDARWVSPAELKRLRVSATTLDLLKKLSLGDVEKHL